MADVGVEYVLTSGGPTITFNDGTEPFDGQDKYYITEIRGLESPTIRTPHDPVPLGDGSLIHPFYYGETQILIEGVLIVSSAATQNATVVIRNQMTADLKSALNSILRANGTLAFTPQGQGAQSIIVNYNVGLETPHADNYNSLQFSFGLIAGQPYS